MFKIGDIVRYLGRNNFPYELSGISNQDLIIVETGDNWIRIDHPCVVGIMIHLKEQSFELVKSARTIKIDNNLYSQISNNYYKNLIKTVK